MKHPVYQIRVYPSAIFSHPFSKMRGIKNCLEIVERKNKETESFLTEFVTDEIFQFRSTLDESGKYSVNPREYTTKE